MEPPETTVERRNGVTLVQVLVRNSLSTRQTVRLRNRIDGPTWPPRRSDDVVPEWRGDTWEGTLEPGECRGVGFATPAEPVDPPVELVSSTRARSDGPANTDKLLASLDGWAPPSRILDCERSTENE